MFLLSSAALVLNCVEAKGKLNQEFLQGFDTGILVRSDNRAFKDFQCPIPDVRNEGLKKLNQLTGPMKMAATFANNDQLTALTNSLETFVSSMQDMMGVFNADYDGGDFCKGLIFGRDGSNMLYEVAQTFVDDADKREYESQKKKNTTNKASKSSRN